RSQCRSPTAFRSARSARTRTAPPWHFRRTRTPQRSQGVCSSSSSVPPDALRVSIRWPLHILIEPARARKTRKAAPCGAASPERGYPVSSEHQNRTDGDAVLVGRVAVVRFRLGGRELDHRVHVLVERMVDTEDQRAVLLDQRRRCLAARQLELALAVAHAELRAGTG